jgi:hypothetical protein
MILLAAILGMMLHAALTVGYHWLFFRSFLEDGPYYFVVALTSLFGAVLGPAVYVASRYGGTRPFLAAAYCLIAGLTVFGALIGCSYWAASNPDNDATFWRILATLTLIFLPTVMWGALSFRWGVRLLWRAVS